MKFFTILFAVFFIVSCGNSTKTTHDEDETADTVNDSAVDETTDEDTTIDSDTTDETIDSDEDSGLIQVQTGGVSFFTYNGKSDEAEMFTQSEMLGNGGFFGYTISSIDDTYYAIGALHESTPPFDFEEASGKLYLFKKGTIPTTPEDADIILEHPKGALNGGFSFAVTTPCDINGDGNADIVVSAHLATVSDKGAAGEIVVFYGAGKEWKTENSSISTLSETYIQQADVMGQSLMNLRELSKR